LPLPIPCFSSFRLRLVLPVFEREFHIGFLCITLPPQLGIGLTEREFQIVLTTSQQPKVEGSNGSLLLVIS
jgi:hypothetical protein